MNRTLRLLAALAMVALISVISAGCSNAAAPNGTGSSGGSTNATNRDRDQGVKFAGCMRSNGVREFPDPDASGSLTVDGVANGSSLDTSSAVFKQAIAACKDLQPAGFTGHQRTAQEQENALKFAQCIRDNGVKDFPDPTPDGPLVDTNRIPSTASNGLAAINAAMQKCGDLAGRAGAQGRASAASTPDVSPTVSLRGR